MGFFQDLKDDLSMAVNELIPEENLETQPNEDVSAAISEEEAINADAFRAAVERLDEDVPAAGGAQTVPDPAGTQVPVSAGPSMEPESAVDPSIAEMFADAQGEMQQEEGVSLDELVAVVEAAADSAGEELSFANIEAPVPEAVMQAAPEVTAPMPEPVMQAAPEMPAHMPEPVMQAAPEMPAPMPEPVMQAAPEMTAPMPEPVMQAAPEMTAPMPEAVMQAAPEVTAPMPEPVMQTVPKMPAPMPETTMQVANGPQEALIAEVVTEITDPSPKPAETPLEAQVKEAITQAPAFVLEGEPVDETAVITAGMMIRGDIASHGSLEIEGDVYGNVEILGKLSVSGNLTGNVRAAEVFTDAANLTGDIHTGGSAKIGKDSVVIGNVFATSAVIAGAVKGDIDVHGPVILDTSAVVMGNIKSKSVQINNGAVIEGMCSQVYADVSPATFFDRLK